MKWMFMRCSFMATGQCKHSRCEMFIWNINIFIPLPTLCYFCNYITCVYLWGKWAEVKGGLYQGKQWLDAGVGGVGRLRLRTEAEWKIDNLCPPLYNRSERTITYPHQPRRPMQKHFNLTVADRVETFQLCPWCTNSWLDRLGWIFTFYHKMG